MFVFLGGGGGAGVGWAGLWTDSQPEIKKSFLLLNLELFQDFIQINSRWILRWEIAIILLLIDL